MFGIKKLEQILKPQAQVRTQNKAPSKHRMVPVIDTCSHISQGNRAYQQDAIYVSPSKPLMANRVTRVLGLVCDGMGGMADGGKASATASEMIVTGFSKIENSKETIDIPDLFKQAIIQADKIISSFPKEGRVGSGTTMVAAILENNKLYYASVGDSSIYLFSKGELKKVTVEHNYWMKLSEMVERGELTYEVAAMNKQKEALISFLGIGNVSLMDINTEPLELQYGDMVLLCSDGITKTLKDDHIKRILMDDTVSYQEKARSLVDASTRLNTHSQDNTSAVILYYHEDNLKNVVKK